MFNPSRNVWAKGKQKWANTIKLFSVIWGSSAECCPELVCFKVVESLKTLLSFSHDKRAAPFVHPEIIERKRIIILFFFFHTQIQWFLLEIVWRMTKECRSQNDLSGNWGIKDNEFCPSMFAFKDVKSLILSRLTGSTIYPSRIMSWKKRSKDKYKIELTI